MTLNTPTQSGGIRWFMPILMVSTQLNQTFIKCMNTMNKISPGFVSSFQFGHSVVSGSLWPHELQHSRPPCPSLTARVHPNSCPLSRWCHPTISSCCPLLLPPSIFLRISIFSNESALCIRWPKYWSFSFNIIPSNEHSGLISFRMDWLDLLAVQETLKSLIQHHSSKASILQCSAFFFFFLILFYF